MASALRLLKRDGYRRVRVEDIARDAGVCKATVYHYFTTKDDLLTRSVAARMAERQIDVEHRLTSAGGRATDRLRLILEDVWTNALTAQAGLWQRLVVGEVASDAPEVTVTTANQTATPQRAAGGESTIIARTAVAIPLPPRNRSVAGAT